MKTKSPLVRSDGTVKLYTVTCIDMDLSIVIYPRYAELELSLRLYKSFQKSVFSELLLVRLHNGAKRFQNLLHSLMELRL